MNINTFFGIYPEEIEAASEIFETALEKEGVDVPRRDDLWEEVSLRFEENLKSGALDQTHLSNVLMGAMFTILREFLSERHPEWDVDYFINGIDTHFYVNGEEPYL